MLLLNPYLEYNIDLADGGIPARPSEAVIGSLCVYQVPIDSPTSQLAYSAPPCPSASKRSWMIEISPEMFHGDNILPQAETSHML
ncbi:hypothetical protein D9619_011335 [Psilocybe cf. subviscida]|uniref:Uncharacterized protein n=1 Tax=Psilocybe cf. subviscida TaxID=2480587 RepID=A0A8H5F5V2_9AGAR|nr:hypothetical protein D9619_011335 [Psilocybe cf. subviscida]